MTTKKPKPVQKSFGLGLTAEQYAEVQSKIKPYPKKGR